jgi:hypothetical protein
MRRMAQAAGFTFVEVVVATTILMVVWLAIARIVTISAAANANARAVTLATLLAVEKLEELHALPFDDPAFATSPPGSLATNVGGYYDAPDARYVRRWSIEPLPAHPDSALAIRVTVVRTSGLGDASLATIKSRQVE